MKKILLTLTALSVFTNYIGDASATQQLNDRQKDFYRVPLQKGNMQPAFDLLQKFKTSNMSMYGQIINDLRSNYSSYLSKFEAKIRSTDSAIADDLFGKQTDEQIPTERSAPTATTEATVNPFESLRSEIGRLAGQTEFPTSLTSIAMEIVNLAKSDFDAVSAIISPLWESNKNLYRTLAGSVSSINSSLVSDLFPNAFDDTPVRTSRFSGYKGKFESIPFESGEPHDGMIDGDDHESEVEEEQPERELDISSTPLEPVSQNKGEESIKEETESSIYKEEGPKDSSSTGRSSTSYSEKLEEEKTSVIPESTIIAPESSLEDERLVPDFNPMQQSLFESILQQLEILQKKSLALAEEKADLTVRQDTLGNSIKEAEKRLEELSKEKATNREEFNQKKQHIADLEQAIVQDKKDMEDLEKRLTQIDIESQSVQDSIDSLRLEVTELQSTLEAKNDQISEIKKEINLLEKRRDKLMEEADALKLQLKEKDNYIEELQVELAEVNQDLRILQTRCENLESEKIKLIDQIQSWKDLRLGDTPAEAEAKLNSVKTELTAWQELGENPTAVREFFAQQQAKALDKLHAELETRHKNELAEKDRALEEQARLIEQQQREKETSATKVSSALPPKAPAFSKLSHENQASFIEELKASLSEFEFKQDDTECKSAFLEILKGKGIVERGKQDALWTALTNGVEPGIKIGSITGFEDRVASILSNASATE